MSFFVKTNKNDANDAEAICEAASRPSMHFVPIKQVEQQDIQSLHRIRSRLIHNRTALINEIRGLSLEYGIVIPQGNELTALSREFMQELYDELIKSYDEIKRLDKKIKLLCKQNDNCRRIL